MVVVVHTMHRRPQSAHQDQHADSIALPVTPKIALHMNNEANERHTTNIGASNPAMPVCLTLQNLIAPTRHENTFVGHFPRIAALVDKVCVRVTPEANEAWVQASVLRI